jgi:PAS domain S-box-containing protein
VSPGAVTDAVGDERALLASINLSPIATVITNPRLDDNPVVAANPAFCALTGYEQGEILGRNCRFLAGKETEAWGTERIRESIRSLNPCLCELLNYKKDGTPFRNAVLIAPILDPDGIPHGSWARRSRSARPLRRRWRYGSSGRGSWSRSFLRASGKCCGKWRKGTATSRSPGACR